MAEENGVYRIFQAQGQKRPILLSSPHSGTAIPPQIQTYLKPKFGLNPEDTDWFIDRLYDFAPNLGMTQITAVQSRYVIDLNRDPAGAPLYSDQRVETSLCPSRAFSGEYLYRDESSPGTSEVAERIAKYFTPYHDAVRGELSRMRRQWSNVLFFDCHSIKRNVPTIRSNPFPDLIIGTQDGKTAHPMLCKTAVESLKRHSQFEVAYNDPFKGGFLTRMAGDPANGIHAIQLEMSQDLYLDSASGQIETAKWDALRHVLEILLLDLDLALGEINARS